jgi:hypothetical protein
MFPLLLALAKMPPFMVGDKMSYNQITGVILKSSSMTNKGDLIGYK